MKQINEFGISFGVGLPVGKWFSNANLGFEFGKRGTTNQNLIKKICKFPTKFIIK